MPILNDVLENKVLGREFKRGLEEGKQQGREEGKQLGREEGKQQGLEEGKQQGREEGELFGELKVLRRLIEKRFGPLPDWAEKRLAARSASELEELSVRVLDAETFQELLK